MTDPSDPVDPDALETEGTPDEAEPRSRPRRRPSTARSRQTQAIWIAGGLAVLAVVGVLFATLSAGTGKDADKVPRPLPATTRPFVVTTLPKILDGVDLNPSIPEGNFVPLCTEIRTQVLGVKGNDTTEQIRNAYLQLDFDKLIAAAPETFKPTLTTLRDSRPAVATALSQVKSLDQLEAADLPAGFLEALILSGKTTDAKC